MVSFKIPGIDRVFVRELVRYVRIKARAGEKRKGLFTFGMPIWAAMLCLLSLMSLSILLLSIGFGMICSQMDNEQLDRSNIFIPN